METMIKSSSANEQVCVWICKSKKQLFQKELVCNFAAICFLVDMDLVYAQETFHKSVIALR